MGRITFSLLERDGLIYINPLPSCNSSCWWQKALARVEFCVGKLARLFQGDLRHE